MKTAARKRSATTPDRPVYIQTVPKARLPFHRGRSTPGRAPLASAADSAGIGPARISTCDRKRKVLWSNIAELRLAEVGARPGGRRTGQGWPCLWGSLALATAPRVAAMLCYAERQTTTNQAVNNARATKHLVVFATVQPLYNGGYRPGSFRDPFRPSSSWILARSSPS